MLASVLIATGGVFFWKPHKAHAQTDTFTVSGNWTVPTGVTSAVFEAWGGGGAGGGLPAGGIGGGGGGAGGQYAKVTTNVTAGNTYAITVATGVGGVAGANGPNGGSSSVDTPIPSTLLIAAGGAGGALGPSGAGGTGGSIAGGLGDIVYAGGSGAAGSLTASGGGGGGAGSTGAGGAASGAGGGTGTANNGGNGGSGFSGQFAQGGNPGSNYGGGGSGIVNSNAVGLPAQAGSAGAPGLVTVTYTPPNLPPNAPSLSAPVSGSTIASTAPNLTLSAIDPNGDSVKYKLTIYDTTASSGGSCTGTTFLTADQTSSGVGWDNGTTAYASGASSTYTVQNSLTRGSGYCWQAQAIDPSGSATFGSLSSASTFTVDSPPSTPTLSSPNNGATNTGSQPVFQLKSTDADSDYLRYKIELCQDSLCSTVLQTWDQTSTQAGWSGQDQQSGTAYLGGSSMAGSTTAIYQPQTALSGGATYYWRAYAIDPGGSNIWSAASAIQSFSVTTGQVKINGGVGVKGGTIIN